MRRRNPWLRFLFERRTRNRITKGGALFVAAMFLTGAGAFLSANNLLFLIFSAMLALLLVSGFLSRLVLAGLELELLLPEHVTAGAPGPARVRLRNMKRLTPSFSIELSGRPDPLNNAPSILQKPVYFPLIAGRSTVETGVEVVFPWRGRHRDNLFVLSTKFPFGFLRMTTRVTLQRETIVYPSLQPSPEAEDVLADVTGGIETHFRGSGLDFYRVRPYEPNDSARLVDWKGTAHTGELQVREFSRDERRAVEIFLDRRIPSGRHDWFESAVEQCAYLAWHLAERNTELLLRSQRAVFEVPAEADIHDVLRHLALIEATIVPLSENETAEPPLDVSGLQIVLTARPGSFTRAGWRPLRVVSPEESDPRAANSRVELESHQH